VRSPEAAGAPEPAAVRADRGALDVLRAFAVVCVVAFHLLLLLRRDHVPRELRYLGHWGVLVFFVHTSTVLMASLERQARRGGPAGYAEFMVARAFRLLPLCYLTVLAIVDLQLPVGHLRDGQFVAVSFAPGDVVQNLLLIQNLGGAESLEAPLWSLPYEIQMYLVLPALFWMASRSRTPYPMLGLWAAVTLAMTWRGHATETGLWDYAPCFLAGVAGHALDRVRRPDLAFWLWPPILAAATVFYLVRPGPVHGWLCCMLVATAVVRIREPAEAWWLRLCRWIARYSYGIYLTHFILMWLAFDALGGAPRPVQVGVFVATLVAVPVALYHLIEAPMIQLGRRVVLRLRARRAQDRYGRKAVAQAR
jgi:peptidoglycan/LPS O-acetylase OafA/YrhL